MPYVNKVVIHGVTEIDLTQDTVTPEVLEEGQTAHDAAGAPIIGISPRPSTKLDKLTTEGLHVYSHDGEEQGELEVVDNIQDSEYTQIPSAAAVKELTDDITENFDNYYTKTEVNELIEDVDYSAGSGISINNNIISIADATVFDCGTSEE